MDFTASSIDSLSTDLKLAKEIVFEKSGLAIRFLQKENESEEYSAYRFELNDKKICYRKPK